MRLVAGAVSTLLGALLLGGCATTATVGTRDAAQDAAPGADAERAALADRLGAAAPGALVSTGGALPGIDEVVVGRIYTAASGRRCRTLRDVQGDPLEWLACERDGRWSMNDALVGRAFDEPRRLRGSAAAHVEPAVGEARSGSRVTIDTADPHPAEASAFTLQDGESLWAFAARVTDDPLHWRRIAAHNGIADGSVVQAGRLLDVPRALLD